MEVLKRYSSSTHSLDSSCCLHTWLWNTISKVERAAHRGLVEDSPISTPTTEAMYPVRDHLLRGESERVIIGAEIYSPLVASSEHMNGGSIGEIGARRSKKRDTMNRMRIAHHLRAQARHR